MVKEIDPPAAAGAVSVVEAMVTATRLAMRVLRMVCVVIVVLLGLCCLR
jgi:hypothetical protein